MSFSLFLFLALVMFCLTSLQVLLGSYGFWVPAAAWLVFYISVTYNWRSGLIAAIVQGTVIDLLYNRAFLLTPVLIAMVVVIAQVWLYRADGKALYLKIIPGVLIGLICVLPQAMYSALRLGWNADLFLSSMLSCLFSVIISAGMLPLTIALLDSVAERLDLPRFSKAKEEIIHRR